MKLRVSHDLDHPVETEGIVYLLEIDVDGKRVVKIGVTARKIEDRVCEILTSYFKAYRFFPYCRPKRFRKADKPYEKEAQLLKYFRANKFESEKTFSGCQELVDVDLDKVVDVYERLLDGFDIWDSESSESGEGAPT